MVAFRQVDEADCTFTVSPNCALGWCWMKRVFWLMSACISAVAVWWASQGAWLILPFAGLEMALLGSCIYLNARWSACREVIALSGPQLRVLRGRRVLQEVACLPRYWTRVRLLPDPRHWYPSRLLLECRGHRIEIGQVLVEAERHGLAEDLRRWLGFDTAASHGPHGPAGWYRRLWRAVRHPVRTPH